MGEEQLLQLAQQFLFSDAGKKIIGEDVDLNSLKKQILINEKKSYNYNSSEARFNQIAQQTFGND